MINPWLDIASFAEYTRSNCRRCNGKDASDTTLLGDVTTRLCDRCVNAWARHSTPLRNAHTLNCMRASRAVIDTTLNLEEAHAAMCESLATLTATAQSWLSDGAIEVVNESNAPSSEVRS